MKTEKKLPSWDKFPQLSDASADFFTDKISKFSEGRQIRRTDAVNQFPEFAATPIPILDKFQPATVLEMSDIIRDTK